LRLEEEHGVPECIIKYVKIPLKSGAPNLNYAVNWHIEKDDFNELRKKPRALLPEIAVKYINTYEFLYNRRKEDGYGKNGINK